MKALVDRARAKVATYADERTYGSEWTVLRQNHRGIPLTTQAIFGRIVRSANAVGMRSMATMVSRCCAPDTATVPASDVQALGGARTALLNVLSARAPAWLPIQRSVVFQTLSAIANVDSMYSNFGASLFHAIALGERALASHLAAKVAGNFRGERREHASSFALALHARWLRPDSELRPLGRHGAVFGAWTDTRSLARALADICTEHLRRISFCDENDAQWDHGYELCPIELAALRVVREQEGLETPWIDHPLLSTPCAAIPRGPMAYEPERDALLSEAAALAREIAPEAALAIDQCLRSLPRLPPPIAAQRHRVELARRKSSVFSRAVAWLAFESPPEWVDPELDAMAFAELALDSTGGVNLDWKLTHDGVLEELDELGVSVAISPDPKWSRDELMRAVIERLNDGRTAVRLRQFDESAMDGYVLLHRNDLRGLRAELGDEFHAIFHELERV